jgi:hypothetical protein
MTVCTILLREARESTAPQAPQDELAYTVDPSQKINQIADPLGRRHLPPITTSPNISPRPEAPRPAQHPQPAVLSPVPRRRRGCSGPSGEFRGMAASGCSPQACCNKQPGDLPAPVHLGFLRESRTRRRY